MSVKVFSALVSISLLLYFFCIVISNVYDSDMYFLVETGREIIRNGIPKLNPWHIEKDLGFIAQQWLYDVIIAFFNKFDFPGLFLFLVMQLVLFGFLLHRFFRLKNVSFFCQASCMIVIGIFCKDYVFCLRPELITFCILLYECIVLERYRETSNARYLIALPFLSILEINLHASMWVFHFCILLAYIVPCFYLKKVNDDSLFKHLKQLLPFILLMFAVLFINPYEIDGVFYIFKSFLAKTFDIIPVVEISRPVILGAVGIQIFLCFLFLFLCRYYHVLSSTTCNITLGFVLLAVMMYRNSAWMVIVFCFLFRELGVYFDSIKHEINWQKDVKNYFLLLFGAVICVLVAFIIRYAVKLGNSSLMSANIRLSYIADYIEDEYGSKDARLFTGFDTGSFFEYAGFRNVYMDARPEIYTTEFNHKHNILREYVTYCRLGHDSVDDEVIYVTDDKMKAFLDYYDFDYFVVFPQVEPFLFGYLMSSSDYERIEDDSIFDSYCILFKPIR